MFSFFKRYQAEVNNPASCAKLETYNLFNHRLVDRTDRADLVSLRIGSSDWGAHARFLMPVVSADASLAFTWELKWVGPLNADLAYCTGWNQRSIWIDLAANKFHAGPWKELTNGAITLKPTWDTLERMTSLDKFHSTATPRGWSRVIEVNEQHVIFQDRDDVVELAWSDIEKIHFSKTSVANFEIPHFEVRITSKGDGHCFDLPSASTHPFYQQLIRMNVLAPEALSDFINAETDAELLVLSETGALTLPLDRCFDVEQARLGIILGEVLVPWAEIKDGVDSSIDNARIGGIEIVRLDAHETATYLSHFPPQSFSFSFSTINGAESHPAIIDQVAKWVRNKHPECTYRFNADWSSFLSFESPVFKLELSYSDSEGHGSLTLQPEFYRNTLLRMEKFQVDFSPTSAFELPVRGAEIHNADGFSSQQVFPAPAALHKASCCFWKDAHGRIGLSAGGYLYLWQAKDLLEIENQVSDEYSDRGGPYYDTILIFKDKAITLRTPGGLDLSALHAFLGRRK